jgi:cytochrome c556
MIMQFTARWLVALLLGMTTLGAALAAGDPVGERRALMRDNQKQERAANSVILGKFRPEKATAAMQKLQANMLAFVELFPEGSQGAAESKADPSIWTQMEDFRALAMGMIEDAKAAESAIANGQDAFGAAWQLVAEDCSGCHEKYTPR